MKFIIFLSTLVLLVVETIQSVFAWTTTTDNPHNNHRLAADKPLLSSSKHPTSTTISRRDVLLSSTGCVLPSLLLPQKADAAVTTEQSSSNSISIKPEAGRYYFPTLTPPFQNRATLRYDISPTDNSKMWSFEQLLTFANVTATIRTTVIQMQNNDLWVHSPQWPTGEFCTLLNELPGEVKHIVLPCNAFEHKAPMKAFINKYPNVSVWIAPGQYGPLGTCGYIYNPSKTSKTMGYHVDGILYDSPSSTSMLPPWIDEFDYTTLYIDLPENAGPVTETAFYHKPSKTLIATDAVVYIPSKLQSPNLFETYFDIQTVQDRDFWPKTVLQSVFLPLRYDDKDRIYPGFEAIVDRVVRAPILRGFNDARGPEQTKVWIEQICQWDFDRIITSHFTSPIIATKDDFRNAFAYLYFDDNDEEMMAKRFSGKIEQAKAALPPISCQDWELLDSLNKAIAEYKLGAPATFDYKRGCLQ